MLIKSVIVIALVLTVVGRGDTACKSSPPTLPPGGKWIPNEGCTSGKVYFTAGKGRQRCHCWGHCGYICESAGGSKPGGGNGGGGKPGQGGSPCAFGGVYFNGKGQRCHCQSFNKQPYYVCETPTTTTTTVAPGSGGNSSQPGAKYI